MESSTPITPDFWKEEILQIVEGTEEAKITREKI
jgi:hypothetical protein